MNEQQQEIARDAFSSLGFEGEALENMVSGFANAESPTFDKEAFLLQAQTYATPFVKDLVGKDVEKERAAHWKGQYMNDYAAGLVKASGGKITRKDVEGKTPEEAFKLLISTYSASDTVDLQKMLSDLNAEKETWEKTYAEREEAAVNKVRSEYEAREQQRTNFEKMLTKIGSKPMVQGVDKSHAATMLLLQYQAKGYDLKWNDTKGTFDVYERGTQNLAKKNGTALVEFEKELDADLKGNNWLALSNGGEGGSNPKPILRPTGKQSVLGAALEKAGAFKQ